MIDFYITKKARNAKVSPQFMSMEILIIFWQLTKHQSPITTELYRNQSGKTPKCTLKHAPIQTSTQQYQNA